MTADATPSSGPSSAHSPKTCFEDFFVGQIREHGPYRLSREEVLAFAAEFDPQPMHLDEDAANKSILKGLSASGWHSSSIMMRMIYDGVLHDSSSCGGPGVEEMRWIKPVRPGDELSIRLTCLEARESKSLPGIGIVRHKLEMMNQRGETVLESTYPGMFRKRHAGAAA
jgi:acyl dehydratase